MGSKDRVALLQSADLHLGGFRNVYNYLVRTQMCCDAFVNAVLSTVAEHIILVLSGDFWHELPKETERSIGYSLLLRLLKDPRVHIIMVNGNHDYFDHNGLTLIHGFESLSKHGLLKNLHVVVNDPDVVTLRVGGVKYRFLCVPCQQNLTTKTLRVMLKTLLKTSSGKFDYTYAVIHEAFNSSVSESNHRMSTNVEIPDLDVIDGYLIGDIHKRQQIGNKAWYCGSPWQTKYDEELQKGILRWRGSEVEFIEVEGVPKLYEFKTEKLVKKYAGTEHSVRYTGLKKLDFEAPNVFCVPKVDQQDTSDEANVTNDVEEKSSKIRALTKKDLIVGLRGFLQGDAKLPEDEAAQGVRYVKRELDIDTDQ